ncbi:hypothetical protein K402DRAFT_406203 [Aulographum hederae CBS 113979]|uniref:PHD finger domain-containing protein n=1 Tax=Aulographum hederae CBS 113979 TaxID=1176131 RepID=A0A6G1GTV4_9PEZI|nr:hypothetical protein K402DRAFT_406203 [Aulographum hederae CBS 113979]
MAPLQTPPPRRPTSARTTNANNTASTSRPTTRPRTQPDPSIKKRRYIPGGPGGGGRYVDDDGKETPVGGTGPGGYLYTGPRGRVGRFNAENGVGGSVGRSPTTTTTTGVGGIVFEGAQTEPRPRPRRNREKDRIRERERRARKRAEREKEKERERLAAEELAGEGVVVTKQPQQQQRGVSEMQPRYTTATAAAAAVQSEGYKPREERGWEEFHPDLDIEAELFALDADEVDGIAMPNFARADKLLLFGRGKSQGEDDRPTTPDVDTVHVGGPVTTPRKKGPGRPPRRTETMLNGLGSPPAPRIIPIPTHNPKERLNLSKPQFRKVETFATFEGDQKVGINYVDRSMSSLGFQESDMFARANALHYIRGGEGSLEDELDQAQSVIDDGDLAMAAPLGRVEYDMDEQDDRWLEAINAQRKEEQAEPIKPAMFEITMTQIEKEWHALEKRIPKPNPKPPQTHRPRSSSAAAVNGEPSGPGEEQDTKCAICDDGDCENTNAIIFCDGCDLAVHQECYGVPFIPEGQWHCRKCQQLGRNTPTCIFCPNIDGAFKQTSPTQRWSHLLCAIWIPEVSLGNTTFMEPVMDVEKVPKSRWKLHCYLCNQKMGACIQCGNKNCYLAFHVTCARRAKLYLKMKSGHNGSSITDASVLKALCDKHVPSDWRREYDVDAATREAKDFYRRTMRGRRWADSQTSALMMIEPPQAADDEMAMQEEIAVGSNKRKRGQNTRPVWRLPSGAPVVPAAVYNRVETSLVRLAIRKRKEFVAEACKYWTLKREARRGAALLKRLQRDMESFSSMEITRRDFVGMGAAGGPRLQRRIEFAEELELDMEKVRVMCGMVRQKEEQKLEDVRILGNLVDTIYFPVPVLLRPILEKAQGLDQLRKYFEEGFQAMKAKLDGLFYVTVSTFSADIMAVFSEAIGFDSFDDAGDSHDHPNGHGIPHSELSAEQKDKKKFAKRIIKAIQPMLHEATRKEADLMGKPAQQQDFRDLEALLERNLHAGHATITSMGEQTANGDEAHEPDAEGEDELEGNGASQLVQVNGIGGAKTNGIANHNTTNHFSSETAMEIDEKSPRQPHNPDETTDDAIIHLHFPDAATNATIAIPTHHHANENGVASTTAGSAPSLSASGSTTNPSTTVSLSLSVADPLTPPRDTVTAGAGAGGIPWYLRQFDIKGTEVNQEVWTGREVMRGLSEELSDMDDEELDGLVGVEGMGEGNGGEEGGGVAGGGGGGTGGGIGGGVTGVTVIDGNLAPPVVEKVRKKAKRRSGIFSRRVR